MRDAMEDLGGDATKINPLVPVELVIDHSIQVDVFAERLAFKRNAEFEFERNKERYAFLRWGQKAFDNFAVVPPNTGICHQVNLEYLARVVESRDGQAFPDTLVGTDSHTTMVNGLGVLGWGVGGIEAEAAMLGQPVSMLVPQVVGFRLTGELPEGATATDLVLTVTQMLRERGVVASSSSSTAPGCRTCRSPTARRSGTCRPRWAPPARSSRSTRRRSATSSSPAARRSASSWSRPTARAGSVPRRGLRGGGLLRHAGARPRRRGALARRAEAPAGPRGALRRGLGLPRRARGVHGPRDADRLRRGASTSRSPRATRPTNNGGGESPKRRPRHRAEPGTAVRRARGGLRTRVRRDRRHHELHQHVEPVGDDRARGCWRRRRSRRGSSGCRG